MKYEKVFFVVLIVGLIATLPAFGEIRINPNDDTTMRGSSEYNASSPFGLFVKTANYDVSYMEYTLGSVVATDAKLVIHNDDSGPSAQWTINVNGAEYGFTEGSFNDTGSYTDGLGWASVGTIPGVQAVAFYEMDLSSWYNDNLGKTMTLFMYAPAVPNSGSGPIFEDKEGTKTGDAILYGPRLEITEIPEPATMLLLGIGGLALIRRRRA